MTLREAVISRAERDEKFCDELIDKLEERAKEYKAKLVILERSLRILKKFKK